MSNVLISNLPLYTGLTNSGWLVFNDSGETTTSKIKVQEIFYLNNDTAGIDLSTSTGATNMDLLLREKGNGAIVRSYTGNPRGDYAVDLQPLNSSNSQVASGIFSVAFGQNNTASGDYSFVAGINNTAAQQASAVFGQECSTGNAFSFAAGYRNNSAGNYATTFGYECSANSFSFAAGRIARANGDFSFALGNDSSADATASFASGVSCLSSYRGSYGHGASAFYRKGDNMFYRIIASRRATNFAPLATSSLSMDNPDSGGDIDIDIRNASPSSVVNYTLKYNIVCNSSGGGAQDPAVGAVKTATYEFSAKYIISVGITILDFHLIRDYFDTHMDDATVVPTIVGSNIQLVFTAPSTTNNNSYVVNATLEGNLVGW